MSPQQWQQLEMVLRQLLLPLGLGMALARVEAGRGRGSPSTTTPAPPPLPGPIDLTLPLERNSTPAEFPFQVTRNVSAWGEFGWASAQTTCSSGQAGTHLRAPFHLNERGWKVDELPLDRLLVSGVLLDVTKDVSPEAALNASFVLTAEHLVAWEKKHGAPPAGAVLVIRFGWPPPGPPGPARNATAMPGVSGEAAAHLVTQGRVVGVGADVPALDNVPGHGGRSQSRADPAARALAAANIYTLLNLDLSHELPAKGFSLLVMPTKVRAAAAAAVRVVATTRSPSPPKSGAPPTTSAAGCLAAVVAAAVLARLSSAP